MNIFLKKGLFYEPILWYHINDKRFGGIIYGNG